MRKVFKGLFRKEIMVDEETTETTKPTWIKMKPAELEKKVVELAKEGKSPAQIGLILRDNHGVPRVKLMGKRVTHILKENNITYKSDKDVVDGKLEKLRSHIGKNKHDYSASRSLSKGLWDLRKASKKAA